MADIGEEAAISGLLGGLERAPDGVWQATRALLASPAVAAWRHGEPRAPDSPEQRPWSALEALWASSRPGDRALIRAPAGSGASSLFGAFCLHLTRRGLARVAFIPISVHGGMADPSIWVAALHARLGALTSRKASERALAPRVADDIRPILDGDENPETPLLIVLDRAHENDDPTVWSRIGWSAGLPGNVRMWVSADNDPGVTAARWGEALHWLNDWSDLVLEMPSERSATALPGDVDADTVCVLSAASGPISEAELAQIVGGDRAEARVSATLRKLEPWLCHTTHGAAFLHRSLGKTLALRLSHLGDARGQALLTAHVQATLDSYSEGSIAPVTRSEYVIRYGAMHFLRHDATAEELDRVISEPMRAAWEPLDGGAFGFRALVVAAWRRSHAAFCEATSEASRGPCMVQALRLRTIFEQIISLLVHALPDVVAGAIHEGIFRPDAGIELAKPLNEKDRLRLWRAVRPAVSEADVAWPTPLLHEADRAVGGLEAAGATEPPSAYQLDRRRFVLGGLKSRRVVKALVIGALRRMAERLRSPAREEVLLLAARRLAGLHPERRASWAALLAPLYPEERRAERLEDVDAQSSALPELGDRLEVLTERLLGSSAGASAIVQRAMGWLLSSERFPLTAQRFLFHVPESEWNRLVPEEARALVRRWQGESRGSADSLGPLRCGQLPPWLVAEVQDAPLAEVKERTDVSDRNFVASELVSLVTVDVRAELARMFFSVPPEAFRGEGRAIENWAESATLEELRYIHQKVLPCMGSQIDDALAALSLRAVELGDRDLATSFCAAMEGDDDRHQAELEIALALGPFSDVERLVRPDLDDEEASGMLEMVGKALKGEEHAERFAELVRGAARASNRLSAWATVFPSLSPEARERLSAAVADTVKEVLREPPEESDDTLCSMFPWMPEESLCDVWRERASPEAWRPTVAEITPLFTYDRRYDNGACLDTLLLRLGGEAALVAWARTLAGLDDWFSEIGPGPEEG
ncbi:hypothetical protein WME95_17405 [Sorangium sp. So ce327]|uniref:hypothetical protein n=1 Tax=Sorangium sp. So ce327 TaxID=3133301 RepID=UPI003F6103B4